MAAMPTPEEKLFAVIQGASQPPIRRGPQGLAHAAARIVAAAKAVDLPRINQALMAVVALLGVLCLASPFVMRPRLEPLLTQATQPAAPAAVAPLAGLRPADVYLDVMIRQDPFRIGEQPVTAPVVPVVEPPPPDPQALVAGFKLVGVSWGKEPTAMVEDEQHQTHFLRTGDPLGALTVKEIQKDRVIFSAGEQEAELF